MSHISASVKLRGLSLSRVRGFRFYSATQDGREIDGPKFFARPFTRTQTVKPWSPAKVTDVLEVDKSGIDILNDPLYNKGTAFPIEERDRLGLRGLLPPKCGAKAKIEISMQVKRIMNRYNQIKLPINKYQHLMSLQDRNEILFYKVLIENLEEMAPIVYTPTVGEACKQFGLIFRRPRGMYFSADDLGNMHAMVYNWPREDVKLVVITDGSRVLGLGDLGVNGMGISVGKLSLYVAAAGIHPASVLPVVVDVGTNNESLLNDDLYLGLPQRRLEGAPYFKVLDQVLAAIFERWPNCLIQFEDFNNVHALPILDRYKSHVLCFNDDIQGTGAVASGAVMSGLAAIGYHASEICNQRIVIAGAGAAGVGIARSLHYAMTRFGASPDEASQQFWMVDQEGLLGIGRKAANTLQLPFIRDDMEDKLSLLDVIKIVKPNVLIGVTGQGGLFTEEMIRTMAEGVHRPFVFPLSNPTSYAECTAEEVFQWTNGKALFASGSPFDPVSHDGVTLFPNQANNMYTFPGIGLGAVLCQASRVTEGMLHAASVELASQVSPREHAIGKLFPELSKIREVSKNIAVQVIRAAQDEDVAKKQLPRSQRALKQYVEENMWYPTYPAFVRPYSPHL